MRARGARDVQSVQGERLHQASPHELGAWGEQIAADYLVRRGWEILERNWVCPCGEADIIAHDGNEHVLVEVKTRLADPACPQPYPELAVDQAKRQRYLRIAQCYLGQTNQPSVRFDVIAITVETRGVAHLRHILGAFGGDA